MILISTTGDVRFWETMSLALANVERYQSLRLELEEDDFAQRIFKIDVSLMLCRWSCEFILLILIVKHIYRHDDFFYGLSPHHFIEQWPRCAEQDTVDSTGRYVW